MVPPAVLVGQQSAGHEIGLSKGSQNPSPQHDWGRLHAVAASGQQLPKTRHEQSQAHTPVVLPHAPIAAHPQSTVQVFPSSVPSQIPSPHTTQSAGQFVASSPGSHVPSPQHGPQSAGQEQESSIGSHDPSPQHASRVMLHADSASEQQSLFDRQKQSQ